VVFRHVRGNRQAIRAGTDHGYGHGRLMGKRHSLGVHRLR